MEYYIYLRFVLNKAFMPFNIQLENMNHPKGNDTDVDVSFSNNDVEFFDQSLFLTHSFDSFDRKKKSMTCKECHIEMDYCLNLKNAYSFVYPRFETKSVFERTNQNADGLEQTLVIKTRKAIQIANF